MSVSPEFYVIMFANFGLHYTILLMDSLLNAFMGAFDIQILNGLERKINDVGMGQKLRVPWDWSLGWDGR